MSFSPVFLLEEVDSIGLRDFFFPSTLSDSPEKTLVENKFKICLIYYHEVILPVTL